LDDHVPTAADLAPVGIAAAAASVKVSHIKVLRDIYYISVFGEGVSQSSSPLSDFNTPPDLSNPRNWKSEFGRDNRKPFAVIKLDPPNPAHPEKDQFFVLGDNSAQSSDGRLWHGQYWVERELLIGKALFIYWPHGLQIPYVPLPVNVVPNFPRMHLVR
jgi:signal peptidase I